MSAGPQWTFKKQTRQAPEQSLKAGTIMLKALPEIPAEPIEWLWPNRIPRGKLTLLVGNPGLGKTLVTTALASVLTTGGCWPVDRTRATPGAVIFLSAEDDPGDTLRPRLEAAGADLSRVYILQGTVACYTGDGSQYIRMFDLQQDIDALSRKLAELPEVAAVIIDPISAYLGEGVDSHKNAEVRRVLTPLITMIAERRVALIGISHLSKGGGPEALLRVIGSIAFVAAARAAYLIGTDPQDKSRRLFLPLKENLSPAAGGLAFSIEGATVPSPRGLIETARVIWEPEPVTMTVDEAIRPAQPAQSSPLSVLEQATEWLRWTLQHPMEAKTVYARGASMGMTVASIRRAAGILKVRKRKNGMEGNWTWALPEDDQPEGAQAEGAQASTS
jgi:putative DNA primase/helicase